LYHFFGVAANVVLSTKFVWPDHWFNDLGSLTSTEKIYELNQMFL
jgi:hypothetical protein